MAWLWLVLAGLLEIAWAIGMKYTQGFTRPLPSLLTFLCMCSSFFLLGLATRDLPIGTAYAVWGGIGASGTVIVGMVLFGEPAHAFRLLCVGLILAGIAGLKLTTAP